MDPIEFLALDPFLERERRRKQSHSNNSSANSSPSLEHKKKDKTFGFNFLQRRNSLPKVALASPSLPVLFPLLSLQPELLLYVISFMEARQLLDISQTCKLLHDLYTMNAHFLWRGVCGRRFGLSSEILASKRHELHWKTYYAEKTALLKPASFCWTLVNSEIKDRPTPRMCHTGTSLPSVYFPSSGREEDGNGWQESDNYDRVVYIGGQSGQTTRFDDVYVFNGSKFQKLNDALVKNAIERSMASIQFSMNFTFWILLQ
jgi:hypothetical protein